MSNRKFAVSNRSGKRQENTADITASLLAGTVPQEDAEVETQELDIKSEDEVAEKVTPSRKKPVKEPEKSISYSVRLTEENLNNLNVYGWAKKESKKSLVNQIFAEFFKKRASELRKYKEIFEQLEKK